MEMVAIEWSTLRTIGYDKSREVLRLEFQSGAVYDYVGVPAEVHAELLQARSAGAYFNARVRRCFLSNRRAESAAECAKARR